MRCDHIRFFLDERAHVSIHTPTWGVTTQVDPLPTAPLRFNPHTYMRCDKPFIMLFDIHWVSIHTPTWGVTMNNKPNNVLAKFQSTHLHEVWPLSVTGWLLPSGFQSTHLHEVWLLCAYWINSDFSCFNPHTYMRCDLLRSLLFWFKNSFNPHTYMRCDHQTSYH